MFLDSCTDLSSECFHFFQIDGLNSGLTKLNRYIRVLDGTESLINNSLGWVIVDKPGRGEGTQLAGHDPQSRMTKLAFNHERNHNGTVDVPVDQDRFAPKLRTQRDDQLLDPPVNFYHTDGDV